MIDVSKMPKKNGQPAGFWVLIHRNDSFRTSLAGVKFDGGRTKQPVSGRLLNRIICAVGKDIRGAYQVTPGGAVVRPKQVFGDVAAKEIRKADRMTGPMTRALAIEIQKEFGEYQPLKPRVKTFREREAEKLAAPEPRLDADPPQAPAIMHTREELEAFTVAELRELALLLGMKLESKLLKADVVDAILQYEAGEKAE